MEFGGKRLSQRDLDLLQEIQMDDEAQGEDCGHRKAGHIK